MDFLSKCKPSRVDFDTGTLINPSDDERDAFAFKLLAIYDTAFRENHWFRDTAALKQYHFQNIYLTS